MMKIAFVFPGQGSQQVGMLADLAKSNPVITHTYAEASAALGYDMGRLIADGPAEELNKTENTQPALLTASIALFRLWEARGGVLPALLAGHSLGEYSALVASGALEFADAVKLVQLRGQLMQQAVPSNEGLMAAILGLTDEQVVAGCRQAEQGEVVAAANFNTPGQVVIAGARAAVERAIEVLKEMGAKRALPLAVSVPSHCLLMAPAAERLAEQLHRIPIAAPKVPVVQNRVAQAVTDITAIKTNLTEQLYEPVLWSASVTQLVELGVEEIIECGPGKVLTGLNKRIAKQVTHTVISDLDSFTNRLG